MSRKIIEVHRFSIKPDKKTSPVKVEVVVEYNQGKPRYSPDVLADLAAAMATLRK